MWSTAHCLGELSFLIMYPNERLGHTLMRRTWNNNLWPGSLTNSRKSSIALSWNSNSWRLAVLWCPTTHLLYKWATVWWVHPPSLLLDNHLLHHCLAAETGDVVDNVLPYKIVGLWLKLNKCDMPSETLKDIWRCTFFVVISSKIWSLCVKYHYNFQFALFTSFY